MFQFSAFITKVVPLNKRPDLRAVYTTDSFSCCFHLPALRRFISFSPRSTSTTSELLQKHTHTHSSGFYLFRGILYKCFDGTTRTTACNCRSSHGCWLRYETWWRGTRRKYWSRTAAMTADYSRQVIRWRCWISLLAVHWLIDSVIQVRIKSTSSFRKSRSANDRICGGTQKISEMVWTPSMSWFVRIKRVVSHIRPEISQRSRESSENEHRFKREKRAPQGLLAGSDQEDWRRRTFNSPGWRISLETRQQRQPQPLRLRGWGFLWSHPHDVKRVPEEPRFQGLSSPPLAGNWRVSCSMRGHEKRENRENKRNFDRECEREIPASTFSSPRPPPFFRWFLSCPRFPRFPEAEDVRIVDSPQSPVTRPITPLSVPLGPSVAGSGLQVATWREIQRK